MNRHTKRKRDGGVGGGEERVVGGSGESCVNCLRITHFLPAHRAYILFVLSDYVKTKILEELKKWFKPLLGFLLSDLHYIRKNRRKSVKKLTWNTTLQIWLKHRSGIERSLYLKGKAHMTVESSNVLTVQILNKILHFRRWISMYRTKWQKVNIVFWVILIYLHWSGITITVTTIQRPLATFTRAWRRTLSHLWCRNFTCEGKALCCLTAWLLYLLLV